MTDQPTMVANPRRAELEAALASARPEVVAVAAALDDALAAMRSQAWVSKTADVFSGALTSNDKDAERAGQGCLEALQHAHDRLPEQVPASQGPSRPSYYF